MNSISREQKIQSLKDAFEGLDQFSAAHDGQGDKVDLDVLRLAVMAYTLDTFETSLNQISICFEISKIMFFYSNMITPDPKLKDEKNRINRDVCSHNFQMAAADMIFATHSIDQEITRFENSQTRNQSNFDTTLELLQRCKQLAGQFQEAASFLVELQGRQNAGMALYDSDQIPDIKNSDMCEVVEKLNVASAQNTQKAIEQNIELGTIALHILQRQGTARSQQLEEHVALVLNRFDIL